jgi:hypothetical protein
MHQLKEISKLVTEKRSKKIGFIYHGKTTGRYREIAEGIAKDRINSDSEIGDIIGAKAGSGKFKVFKSRLKEKLLNNLFFLDLNDENSTPYSRAIKTTGRNSYCINLLLMLSASSAGAALAKNTLKIALEFELFDVALFCSRVLRKQNSYRGDLALYQYYNDLVEKFHQLVYAEDKSSEYLEWIYVNQVNTNVFKKEVIEQTRHHIELSTALSTQYHTYQTGLRYFRLKAIYEDLCQNYDASLKTWVDFEQFLDNYKKYEYRIRIGESALQQLYCHLCTGNYTDGRICAQKSETLFGLHSNNWFIYKEYYFLLCMHSGNYKEADFTIGLINSIPHFRLWHRNRQEKWKIFEAYNYIIQRANNKDARYNFKLSKFLNDIPSFNKDKEGFNTAVIIIQIMLLLLDRNFSKLPDKVEALKRYANRYFKKEAVYRSHIFMKMLIIADKCNYNKSTTLTKTAALYESLSSPFFARGNSYDGIEIVPYKDLWGIVINTLSDR